MSRSIFAAVVVAFLFGKSAFAIVFLEQIISREDPAFDASGAYLTVGRDGRVYLSSSGKDGFVLRLNRDGTDKLGGKVVYAIKNATANADGILATANGHFAHKVTLYDKDFHEVRAVDVFLVSDQVGWDAPSHVESGVSGDFYGVDQHRDRILRISPAGKLLQTYALPRQPAGPAGLIQDFRVCEKREAFYLLRRSGPIQCVGFDGKLRWSYDGGVAWGEFGNAGGFDVDDDGNLYTLGRQGDTVQKVSPDGKPLAQIPLQMGSFKPGPTEHGFTALRIFGGDIVLKRKHATELFQVYDRTSGIRKHIALAAHEKLQISFPQRVWTAGREIPFEIRFSAGTRAIRPRWRVWVQPIGVAEARELAWDDGTLHVPIDLAGVYQLRVMPAVQPWLGQAKLEYRIRTWVEIRQPGTKGSVSVWTENNRTHLPNGIFGPISILVRTDAVDRPVSVTLELADEQRVVLRDELKVQPNGQPVTVKLPEGALRGRLRSGKYVLRATAAGFSSVPQPLVLGLSDGRPRPPALRFVWFGDYSHTFPSADAWGAPEAAARHIFRTTRLGMDLIVDRLGDPILSQGLAPEPYRNDMQETRKHLQDDPLAAAPQKVDVATTHQQVMAGYDAEGIEQMAILLSNDAGLPLGGPGFDSRKPEQILKDLTRATETLKGHPSFRGWLWAANWWVFANTGGNAARTSEEKAAYEAALKRARETGAWDEILDRVSGYRLGYAVEAEELFNRTLKTLAPHLRTAAACPYRNVESYPPVTLAKVDEVDLQAQWEQIPPPYYAPHNPDFYKRPGKPAWFHAELYNDAGTGDQIVSTLFQALMRGADSIGCNGPIPPWRDFPADSRSSYAGMASIYRALAESLRPYGPWLSTLQPRDRVAIVVSGRMLRIDTWSHVMGTHFARLLEAYASCLHAHHPASFVFVEDLKPDTLAHFQAVLVVGQTVEMEPALAEALQNAKAKGVAVFYDGTCRANLVKDFTPLGVAFDKFEKDPSPASDDAAYWRFPAYCRANLPALKRALDPVATPPAQVDNDEIFLSERGNRAGRFLFVVNNTTPQLEPGYLWRMTLNAATRVPLQASVKIDAEGKAVYDIFAGQRVLPKNGVITADCRSLLARLFAILPAPIHQIELRGPKGPIESGHGFYYTVSVQDANGQPIDTSLPVRVRLLDSQGRVLHERFLSVAPQEKPMEQSCYLAWNGPAGQLTLEATELISRKTARLPIQALETKLPKPFNLTANNNLVPADMRVVGTEEDTSFLPAAERFGPHVRDVVVLDEGKQVVLNTMNWDHNLYALDTETGQLTWRQRIEQYFAFAPRAVHGGLAVQGFRFQTAQGYYLNLLNAEGKVERRFPLYGLPHRLPHRISPASLNDRLNQFAAAPDASWFASAGDLGLAVWDRNGTLLWSQDWWKTRRRSAMLATLSAGELLLVAGMQASAYDAVTGKQLWQIELARTGEVRAVQASADGKACALLATTNGGQVFLLREGTVAAVLPAEDADQIALSADGSHVAAVAGNLLRLYSDKEGLQWVFPGDDWLHSPRFSPDGKRIAVGSELGTLYILDSEGRLLLERDLGALPVAAWLPQGDLLVGTWMGTVVRLDAHYAQRWRVHLQPAETDPREKLLSPPTIAAAPLPRWGNAAPRPAPLKPNLLAPNTVRFEFRGGTLHEERWRRDLGPNSAALTDGKRDAPTKPWLEWRDVGWLAETIPLAYLQFDTFRTQLRVISITLVEDAAHPESWLRDVEFEYWDAVHAKWVPVQTLLSNAAIHTHYLTRPVEAARFRLVLPKGFPGNLRLAEIVLHGRVRGPSHPDVLAHRPVAVLFDEGDDLKGALSPVEQMTFQFEGAYAGGRCLVVKQEVRLFPPWLPPFGHVLPNWDFEIVEKPKLGQYRYLQFAWKAISPKTRGIALQIGSAPGGPQLGIHAGEYTPTWEAKPKKITNTPPSEWQVVRVDLWKAFGRPVRLQTLSLLTKGGGAAFDQILLGRSEKDLPPLKK